MARPSGAAAVEEHQDRRRQARQEPHTCRQGGARGGGRGSGETAAPAAEAGATVTADMMSHGETEPHEW